MKKIFKTLLIGGVALNMMTSCSDFLDQRSPSELTEETVFNSISRRFRCRCKQHFQ